MSVWPYVRTLGDNLRGLNALLLNPSSKCLKVVQWYNRCERLDFYDDNMPQNSIPESIQLPITSFNSRCSDGIIVDDI